MQEGALYGTVLRTTEGGYAMWHECGTSVCYANSSDGKTWSQPKGLDKQQFGAKSNALLTRAGSADKPSQRCSAALGTLAKTASGCRDTQPSVLFTPWESANSTFQMYNFVRLSRAIIIRKHDVSLGSLAEEFSSLVVALSST